MNNVGLPLLLRAFRKSWSAETAQLWREEWGWQNSARGQCAVSSMIVQDYYGGLIARGLTNTGVVHYWNILEGGIWLDVTRDQFGPDEHIVSWDEHPDEYLWKFEETVQKYGLLKSRVEEFLNARV